MPNSSQAPKTNPIGLLIVVALHVAVLYGLWRYHYAPAIDKSPVLMVDLVNVAPQEQPKPPSPPPPKKVVEPPKPQQQIVATAPVVQPAEPVAPPPPPVPAPPPPVQVAPQVPPQPVMLSNELSVSCPDRPPPTYPKASVKWEEEGKTMLRVELDEKGHVASAEVTTSSGYSRLDEAALTAVKSWHCKPAMSNGVAARAVALQPFKFTLPGRK
jgi:protein TonB